MVIDLIVTVVGGLLGFIGTIAAIWYTLKNLDYDNQALIAVIVTILFILLITI